jgi:ankyrin repeat protein
VHTDMSCLCPLLWIGWRPLLNGYLSQLGWAPLHFVNFCPADKAAPVAKLLLDAGAAVDASNSVSGLGPQWIIPLNWQGAQSYAVCRCRLFFFVIHAREQDGNTALILVATSGRLDVVQLLLDSKADINAASKVPVPPPSSYNLLPQTAPDTLQTGLTVPPPSSLAYKLYSHRHTKPFPQLTCC